MGSWGGEDSWQGGGWRTRWVAAGEPDGRGGGWWSYISMRINWEDQLGSETDHITQGSSTGK